MERIRRLANLKPGEHFIELGSGDGRVCELIARDGHRVTGYELAWPIWLISQIRAWRSTNPNLKFKLANFFKHDLGHADVIYFFGLPEQIKTKLVSKLESELKPGTRVLSYAFPIEGWEPSLTDKPKPDSINIFVYQIKNP